MQKRLSKNMKTKLILLAAMVALVVLAGSVSPQPAEASCSGDECGCGYDLQFCMEDCALEPVALQQACRSDCRRSYKRCAISCCSLP